MLHVEIILGFGFMSLLFIIIGVLLSREENFPLGQFSVLVFVGFAIFAMNLMSAAIYTEWNNTAAFNSSIAIPDTLATMSIWALWVYVLFVVVGLIIWIAQWYGRGMK